MGAWALLRIWRARQRVGKAPGGRDGLVAAVFLLNPYLFLPSLALSTSTFENTAVLLTLMFASEGEFSRQKVLFTSSYFVGKPSAALLALAFSTHLSISTFLLLLPVLVLLVTSPVSQLASPQEFKGDFRNIGKYAGQFAVYWLVLFGAASVMVGGEWGWIRETWGARSVFSRRIGLDVRCELFYRAA